MPESEANDLADFAAEACDAILAANGRAKARGKRLASRVDIAIDSNPAMRRLNRDFRRQDKPTDVISFPMAGAAPGVIEGDIAISAAIAAENARRFGHSRAVEIKILILHGLLHLAGFDHDTDRGRMSRLEANLRQQLQLPGSLIERELCGTGRLARSGAAKRRSPRSAR
jgi:probable rRNA maturation factor